MIITVFGMRFGRKTWILAGNVIEIVGTIISASSFSYGQLSEFSTSGRFLVWGSYTYFLMIVAGRVVIVRTLTATKGNKL